MGQLQYRTSSKYFKTSIKRAARIILNAERLQYTISRIMYNKLNWLPFTKRYQIKRLRDAH